MKGEPSTEQHDRLPAKHHGKSARRHRRGRRHGRRQRQAGKRCHGIHRVDAEQPALGVAAAVRPVLGKANIM
ncbi:MAG: hypothetical protein H6880_04025 [Rhodobiaceae bacterium]|nr:hypothetical protein [Rhodobiaceae bacterium]